MNRFEIFHGVVSYIVLLYTCPVDRSSNPVGGKLLAEDKSVDTTVL